MSQPGQGSEEGKPIFLFRSSVGSITTVGPPSLCKMQFSFAFVFNGKYLLSSRGGKAGLARCPIPSMLSGLPLEQTLLGAHELLCL